MIESILDKIIKNRWDNPISQIEKTIFYEMKRNEYIKKDSFLKEDNISNYYRSLLPVIHWMLIADHETTENPLIRNHIPKKEIIELKKYFGIGEGEPARLIYYLSRNMTNKFKFVSDCLLSFACSTRLRPKVMTMQDIFNIHQMKDNRAWEEIENPEFLIILDPCTVGNNFSWYKGSLSQSLYYRIRLNRLTMFVDSLEQNVKKLLENYNQQQGETPFALIEKRIHLSEWGKNFMTNFLLGDDVYRILGNFQTTTQLNNFL